jgi:hypothetical protein
MAFHILNCSVDTPDAQPDYIPEDLSYNDMESVLEVLLENVFDIQDAIAEHDEHDTDDGGSFEIKKQFSFFYHKKFKINQIFDNGLTVIVSNNYFEKFSSLFHPEIMPPPPKA